MAIIHRLTNLQCFGFFQFTYVSAFQITTGKVFGSNSVASPGEPFVVRVAHPRRHGEELEEDPARYEPVVVDEKTEDEADPKHQDAEQKRVDDGAIGIIVLEARYHHGPQDPGGRPGGEDDTVDSRHALLSINVNHHGRHDREAAAEATQHITYQNGEDPWIVLCHQDAKHDQLRG